MIESLFDWLWIDLSNWCLIYFFKWLRIDYLLVVDFIVDLFDDDWIVVDFIVDLFMNCCLHHCPLIIDFLFQRFWSDLWNSCLNYCESIDWSVHYSTWPSIRYKHQCMPRDVRWRYTRGRCSGLYDLLTAVLKPACWRFWGCFFSNILLTHTQNESAWGSDPKQTRTACWRIVILPIVCVSLDARLGSH